MSDIYTVDTHVEKLSKEHKIIVDYVVRFNKSYQARDKAFFKGIMEFFTFLEKDLLAHFRFEEVVIFPAAIIGEPVYETSLMVLSLQKEHGILETELQYLMKELKMLQVSREKLTSVLIERIKAFIEMLKSHAKREMTDLYPMVNADAKCKALLDVYVKELNSK